LSLPIVVSFILFCTRRCTGLFKAHGKRFREGLKKREERNDFFTGPDLLYQNSGFCDKFSSGNGMV
jgi:hypothetical protein